MPTGSESFAVRRRGTAIRPALLGALALVLALLLAPRALASPLGSIREFTSGLSTGAIPLDITAGADGNMWFTEGGPAPAIGRVTPQGQISEFRTGLPAGSSPFAITAGPDGNVWFTDGGTTKAIGRITPQGQITEFTAGLNPGSSPNGIASGPDGNVWFTDGGTTKAIGRITPQGQITEITTFFLNAPFGLAAGADGNVWFIDEGANGSGPAIGRVTPQGQIFDFGQGLSGGSAPLRIAAGADGNLWFTDNGTPPTIGIVGLDGTIFDSGITLPTGASPNEIAPGADGGLWFSDSGTRSIGHVTLGGQVSEFSTGLDPGASPLGIAPGPDGSVWFTDIGTTAAIGQIGTGAPPAAEATPVVAGTGQAGTQQVCEGELWNAWASQRPAYGQFGFDGYQWLRDGVPLTGQTGQSYTPATGDVGHALSCRVTVTYPTLNLTVASSSAALVVLPDVIGPAGAQGQRGPQGKAGTAGLIELVTCTITTRTVKVKGKTHKLTQKSCTAKLVATAIKVSAASSDQATLTRAGKLFARGRMWSGRLLLSATRRVPPGRYTLTITRGSHVIARRAVRIG